MLDLAFNYSNWDVIWVSGSLIIGYCILSLFRAVVFCRRLPSDGKAVFITGCDSGFGYLLCQRMAKLGYKVFAGCLLMDGKGAQELRSFSPNIKVLHLDVTDDKIVKDAAKIVSEELEEKELWAVVNNAGIVHSSELEWTSLQTILNVFNVNTFGMVRVTQQLLPFLKKSKGRIINVTSITAEIRLPGFGGYTMSKAAAKSFNDVIRLELRKWGIKVISIAPYVYGTKITDIDKITALIRDEWNRNQQGSSAGFGTDYLEEYIKMSCEFLTRINNPHVNEVVDCMEQGITFASPKLCYRPGNILNKMVLGVISYFPTSLQDYIQSLFLPSIK